MTFLPIQGHSVLAFAAALAAGWISPAQAELAEAKLEPAISAYLDPLLTTNNFSGVILVAKGDRILFVKGYGHADVEQSVPNGPDTVFQIASVSKPFTAAAIMRLAEQGKINLRAPLTRVLPDYPNGAKLTIHHLLTHSSGIPNINLSQNTKRSSCARTIPQASLKFSNRSRSSSNLAARTATAIPITICSH